MKDAMKDAMIDAFQLPLLAVDSAALLLGLDYFAATLAEIEQARDRLWASMFIFGLAVREDPQLRVRELADAVVRASRRGVDTKILLDAFVEAGDESPGNLVAAHWLLERGVVVRLYQDQARPTDHAKTLIVDDDTLIIGSGNWSDRGLDGNAETALLIRSHGMCEQLANRFRGSWERGVQP